MDNLLTTRQIDDYRAAYSAASQAQRCIAEFLDCRRYIKPAVRTLVHFELIETQAKLTSLLSDIDTKLGLHDLATQEASNDR